MRSLIAAIAMTLGSAAFQLTLQAGKLNKLTWIAPYLWIACALIWLIWIATHAHVKAFCNYVLSFRVNAPTGRPGFADDDPHFKAVRKAKFQNETVELDGKRFEDCQFSNVTLLFHGNAPMEIIAPTFKGSLLIQTDDPAINNFIHVAEVLRGAPNVTNFGCQLVDETGHQKELLSSWTRVGLLKEKPKVPPAKLRDRIFNECLGLKAFLDKYGKRPDPYLIPIADKDEYVRRYQEEVQAWDDKFQADYWLNWKDKILALRHELVLVSLTDDILDKQLMEADTSNLSDKTVETINEKLRMLAARLD